MAVYPAVNATLLGFSNDLLTGSGNFTNYNFAKSFLVQPVAFYSVGFYFQDEFRVTPKLKMTLALRADRNSGGARQHNCASLPIAPFNQLAHGATVPYDQSCSVEQA